MKLELPFVVGEYIWITELFGYSYEVSCLFCNELGVVTLSNNKTMPCGVCNGKKTHVKQSACKIRPKRYEICGYQVHANEGDRVKNPDIWIHVKGRNLIVRPEEIIRSFCEARKIARKKNKKYGWPKNVGKLCERKDFYEHPHRMYWGRKVSKCKKT